MVEIKDGNIVNKPNFNGTYSFLTKTREESYIAGLVTQINKMLSRQHDSIHWLVLNCKFIISVFILSL